MENNSFNVEALRAVAKVFPGGRDMFCEFTGICIASLRNYLYGKSSPEKERLRGMADRLGLPESAFDINENDLSMEEIKQRVASVIRQDYEKCERKKGIKDGEIELMENNITWKDSELPYPYNLIDAVCKEHVDVILSEDVERGLDFALSTLTDREQTVLKFRFQEYMTFSEVGKEFKVTNERIRQIEAKALRKLRHPSRMKYYKFGLTGIEQYNSLKDIQKLIDEKKKELDNLNYEIEEAVKEMERIKVEPYTPKKDGTLKGGQSIEELDLSVRTFNCLRRYNIRTIGQLIEVAEKEEQLLKIRNLGRKSIDEIYNKLWVMCHVDPRQNDD